MDFGDRLESIFKVDSYLFCGIENRIKNQKPCITVLNSLDYSIAKKIEINSTAKKYIRLTRGDCNHLVVFCYNSFIEIIDIKTLELV